MLIDEITLHLKAGNGGNGVVRWRHEKFREYAGASGGNAGPGGDVYVRAVRDIHALARYRTKDRFAAGRGGDGGVQSRQGERGGDLVLDLPIGSVITDVKTGRTEQLLKEGQTIRLLIGGRGGLGNEHFKSSRNTTPQESTPGTAGEEGVFAIELELIADAGLIGLPNAGKSTLLNALCGARAAVGAYPFTTLGPNLGELFGFVLADIPGLIEGASAGKGLGHAFLRHVRRTSVLLHLVSLENGQPLEAYETVRRELIAYDPTLSDKPEAVILTKTDLAGDGELERAAAALSGRSPYLFSVSAHDEDSVKLLRDEIIKLLREHAASGAARAGSERPGSGSAQGA